MASRKRLAQTYYDLAVMLDAGMPILRSFDIVIQGRSGHLRHVLARMRESLSKGSTVAESMALYRTTFPDMDRMLIEAAETSGSLGESFKMLSEWHEFIHRITRRIVMGLLYPFFLLHFAAVVRGGLPYMIMGQLSFGGYALQVFRILTMLYIPIGTVLLFVLLRNRVPVLRLPLDLLVLWIPLLGKAVYQLSICRYARAFAMLYKGGVPIAETAEKATRATGNVLVAGLFAGGVQSVRRGGMACEGFSRRLPTEYLQLWQIGEETGELDRTAEKVAEIAADRADLLFREFARWLPIIVYLVIMVMVAMMILQMWSKVYSGLTAF